MKKSTNKGKDKRGPTATREPRHKQTICVRQAELDFSGMAGLKVNSFFAGIGGFDLAFQDEGFKTAFLCEINPYCNRVLEKHWPNVPKAEDISQVSSKDLPEADVWCGGFPCQDISVARGTTRAGLKGSRSGLFYRYAELVEKRKPQVVVIENVAGLFNSNSGRDFGVVLQRMTGLGYAVAWRLFNSRYFGVPQSRTRVYFVCWLGDPGKAVGTMFEDSDHRSSKEERSAFLTRSTPRGKYPIVPITAFCLAATSGRHTGTDWSRTYVVCRDGVRRMVPVEYERLQGFPDGWTVPLGATDSEELDTLRYTALGNAVSVPVVAWVARRIKRVMAGQEKGGDELPKPVSGVWEDIDLATTDFTDERGRFVWPKAGLAWDGHIKGSSLYPGPGTAVSSTVYGIAEKRAVDRKYYLTGNAAEGILRRVDCQGRTLFPPLRKALEKEAQKK